MKILTIIGARPQFIKAAVVSREFASAGINEVIVHTGQHYDNNMSDVFFDELKIPRPQYNLAVGSGSHGASTGEMLGKIEKVVIDEAPAAVLVYGDTNTTLAGALATKKLNIPLIHVEAGLRSFEMKMPEEINRIVTDRISDILFCPTETAIQNLRNEGFEHHECLIVRSGDVMKDAADFYVQLSDETSKITGDMGLGKFVLCTIHRAENTDDINNLAAIVSALNEVNKEIQVVLPLHPRTRKMLNDSGLDCQFTIIEPVGYLDMIRLLKYCALVMTDSGGLQKEAFFFKKHCVILRNQTEWVELVDRGFHIIAGQTKEGIVKAYRQMMDKRSDFNIDLYGNGNASKIIVNTIKEYFS